MNKLFRLCLMLCVMVSGALAAFAQSQDKPKPNPDQPPTVTAILNRSVTGVEREFVPAAEAMPDDKFSFAPTNGEFKGVRTFGQQVRHVAATNYAIAAALLQEKAPVDLGKDGDEGPASMTSKADIVKYLKDSFDYVHKALATVNDKNPTEMVQSPFGSNKASRLGLSVLLVGHMFDHYGQMVEYLRMNGIIPPASRQQ
jgi:uncharacterized damage-inducible protein DinB